MLIVYYIHISNSQIIHFLLICLYFCEFQIHIFVLFSPTFVVKQGWVFYLYSFNNWGGLDYYIEKDKSFSNDESIKKQLNMSYYTDPYKQVLIKEAKQIARENYFNREQTNTLIKRVLARYYREINSADIITKHDIEQMSKTI